MQLVSAVVALAASAFVVYIRVCTQRYMPEISFFGLQAGPLFVIFLS